MSIDVPTYYRIVGTDGVVELEPVREWAKAGGVRTIRRFAGTKPKIKALFNELTSAEEPDGDLIREDYNGMKGSLEVIIEDDAGNEDGGSTSTLNSVWEIIDIEELKPIETHADFAALTAKNKADIIDAVRNAEDNPVEGAVATKLYAYLSHQMLDYPVIYKELRRSILVSDRNTLTASNTGAGTVVSLPADAPTKHLPIGWEWLYRGASRRQVSRTRYSINQTWLGAEKWAKILGGTWEPTS